MTISARQIAIKTNQVYYNTGKPCSKGHMANRYVSTSNCVICTSIQRRKWKICNPEKIRASESKYRSNNREKWAAKNKRWSTKNPELRMFISARTRAQRAGWEFAITKEDIAIPERCPVLDILLERGNGRHSDASPSLDRIDTGRGYTPDNIMVISHRANTLKGNATYKELVALANYVAAKIRPVKRGKD